MNAQHLVDLTLETWKASGPRTHERRQALLHFYAESYSGPSQKWNRCMAELFDEALELMRRQTQPHAERVSA